MTSAITPDELKAAEERWHRLRDANDPEASAAAAEFQRLARAQTEQLQTAAHSRLISRMLK